MSDIKASLPRKKKYLSNWAQYNYTNMFASPLNPKYYNGLKKLNFLSGKTYVYKGLLRLLGKKHSRNYKLNNSFEYFFDKKQIATFITLIYLYGKYDYNYDKYFKERFCLDKLLPIGIDPKSALSKSKQTTYHQNCIQAKIKYYACLILFFKVLLDKLKNNSRNNTTSKMHKINKYILKSEEKFLKYKKEYSKKYSIYDDQEIYSNILDNLLKGENITQNVKKSINKNTRVNKKNTIKTYKTKIKYLINFLISNVDKTNFNKIFKDDNGSNNGSNGSNDSTPGSKTNARETIKGVVSVIYKIEGIINNNNLNNIQKEKMIANQLDEISNNPSAIQSIITFFFPEQPRNIPKSANVNAVPPANAARPPSTQPASPPSAKPVKAAKANAEAANAATPPVSTSSGSTPGITSGSRTLLKYFGNKTPKYFKSATQSMKNFYKTLNNKPQSKNNFNILYKQHLKKKNYILLFEKLKTNLTGKQNLTKNNYNNAKVKFNSFLKSNVKDDAELIKKAKDSLTSILNYWKEHKKKFYLPFTNILNKLDMNLKNNLKGLSSESKNVLPNGNGTLNIEELFEMKQERNLLIGEIEKANTIQKLTEIYKYSQHNINTNLKFKNKYNQKMAELINAKAAEEEAAQLAAEEEAAQLAATQLANGYNKQNPLLEISIAGPRRKLSVLQPGLPPVRSRGGNPNNSPTQNQINKVKNQIKEFTKNYPTYTTENQFNNVNKFFRNNTTYKKIKNNENIKNLRKQFEKVKKKALGNAKISKAINEANVIIEKQNYTKVNNFIKKYKNLSNYYKSSNENLKKQLKNKLNILQKLNKPMTPNTPNKPNKPTKHMNKNKTKIVSPTSPKPNKKNSYKNNNLGMFNISRGKGLFN